MTSDEQLYGSHKYTIAPLTILPAGADFLVGYGYTPRREFIGRMSVTELLAFLSRPPAEARPAPPILDLDITL